MSDQSLPSLRLNLTLEPHGPATAILLTDEQVASFGAGKAFPVVVTVNDNTFRGRCCRMGGVNMIGLSKAARAQLGVEIGDDIDALVSLDNAERTVDLPAELEAALQQEPAARRAFDSLSYTRRKEMAASIRDAKREEARERRLAKLLAELRG